MDTSRRAKMPNNNLQQTWEFFLDFLLRAGAQATSNCQLPQDHHQVISQIILLLLLILILLLSCLTDFLLSLLLSLAFSTAITIMTTTTQQHNNNNNNNGTRQNTTVTTPSLAEEHLYPAKNLGQQGAH